MNLEFCYFIAYAPQAGAAVDIVKRDDDWFTEHLPTFRKFVVRSLMPVLMTGAGANICLHNFVIFFIIYDYYALQN